MLPALTTVDPAGRYIDWGVIQISVTNLAIILAMVILFVLALVVPFPHGSSAEQVDVRPPTSRDDEEARP